MIDFSAQQRRLTQATSKGEALAADIQGWVASKPWSVEGIIQDDRRGWRLILRVATPPALDEWAFAFGEAVHHLRALLDNVVVTIGTAHGLGEKELRGLQFPISGDTKAWSTDQKRVRSLPEPYRQAIERIQPFQRQGPDGTPDQDPLLLLRDLDNQDKHHLQVRSLIAPAEMEHSFGVEFETAEDASKSLPPDTTIFVDAPFEDGACMLHHRTEGRVAKVKGRYDLRAQVVVLPPGRDAVGITEALAGLCFYTGVVLEHLAQVEV